MLATDASNKALNDGPPSNWGSVQKDILQLVANRFLDRITYASSIEKRQLSKTTLQSMRAVNQFWRSNTISDDKLRIIPRVSKGLVLSLTPSDENHYKRVFKNLPQLFVRLQREILCVKVEKNDNYSNLNFANICMLIAQFPGEYEKKIEKLDLSLQTWTLSSMMLMAIMNAFSNLKYLALPKIADHNSLSDLANLPKLKSLKVFLDIGQEIPNSLTNLTALDLQYSDCRNYSFLLRFSSLEKLNLMGTWISNLTLLEGLSNLRWVDLRFIRFGAANSEQRLSFQSNHPEKTVLVRGFDSDDV